MAINPKREKEENASREKDGIDLALLAYKRAKK